MVESVTPQEAKRLMDEEGYTYLDVRTPEEFQQGHPKGALLIPAFFRGPGGFEPNPDFLSMAQKHLPKDQRLVVGCQSGGRSARACEMLQSVGYANVLNVAGGFGGQRDPATGEVKAAGWRDAGLPVETGGEALS